MTDHRVERVHRPVREQAGQPGDRAPQQRRDHRVGRVLRHRLDGRPRDLRRVEGVRAAADEMGELLTSGGQVASPQVRGDGIGLGGQ